MSKEKKGVYTGIIEQDADGNFFCGPYLLDYKYTVASFKIGDEVNLECDMMAKYVEKLLNYGEAPKAKKSISMDFLERNGFA